MRGEALGHIGDTTDLDSKQGGLGDIPVKVHTVVDSVACEVSPLVEFLNDGSFVHIADTQIVTHPVGSAGHSEVSVGAGGELVLEKIVPMHVRVSHWIGLILVFPDDLVGELRAEGLSVLVGDVGHSGHRAGVHVLRSPHRCVQALLDVDRELRSTLGSRLGGDKDNTVRSLRTVNGGGGGVLQDRDAGDVRRRQHTHRALDAVHHHQRRASVPGGKTSQQQGGVVLSRSAVL